MAGEMLELVIGNDRNLRAKVTSRIQLIIGQSFQQDKSRVTRSEVVRRFRIVELLFRELRSEHKWAFDRILDHMPQALRHKLDGTPWNPDFHRNAWSGDSDKV